MLEELKMIMMITYKTVLLVLSQIFMKDATATVVGENNITTQVIRVDSKLETNGVLKLAFGSCYGMA